MVTVGMKHETFWILGQYLGGPEVQQFVYHPTIEQVRKCTLSVTFLAHSPEFDLRPSNNVVIVTMVTKATRIFPTQSLWRSETHVGLHVKCPLLSSDYNEKWNMLTNFRETLQYNI
jgi:hypothetical protein